MDKKDSFSSSSFKTKQKQFDFNILKYFELLILKELQDFSILYVNNL